MLTLPVLVSTFTGSRTGTEDNRPRPTSATSAAAVLSGSSDGDGDGYATQRSSVAPPRTPQSVRSGVSGAGTSPSRRYSRGDEVSPRITREEHQSYQQVRTRSVVACIQRAGSLNKGLDKGHEKGLDKGLGSWKEGRDDVL